ncbi:MAG: YncE family protein [Cyclobacteriaceae bacterium]|nr:YncE family protein [Cyclobacteriaceae bacterium]
MKTSKHYFLTLLILLTLTFSFSSCDNDTETPAGEFETGVFVINEGSFGKSDGTITHYDPATQEARQDIYGAKNNGLALGDIVQSLSVAGNFAYIVVNNDNKVEVVNARTYQKEQTISSVSLPRYFTTFNGKGYLTEWVSFTDPGRVAVINLSSHTVETTITTDYGSENIIAANNKLFVSNNFTNTISVINPANNQVNETIEVNNAPGEMIVDSESKLWVICGGNYGEDNASLYRINTATNQVDKVIELGMSASNLAINKAKNQLYVARGNRVYKIAITATDAPESAFISVASAVGFYGIGVDPETDEIYLADAKGFAANGTVYRYSATGSLIDEFGAGKGPNGFVFR